MPDSFSQLMSRFDAMPDAIAIRHVRGAGAVTTISYTELRRNIAAFTMMLERETEPGAVIPLLLGKSPRCVAAMIAAAASGRTFACLNRKLRLPQIDAIIEKATAPLVLVDGPGVMAISVGLHAQSPSTSARWRVIVDDSLLSPHRKAVEKMSGILDIGYWSPEPIDMTGLPAVAALREKPACCLFTSGSTGTPKGVLIGGGDLLARARAEAEWFGLTPTDVLLNILPFSFDVGLNQLFTSLVTGCELVLLDSWLPADILRATAEHRVTGISAVPAIWTDMMADLRFDTSGAHTRLRYLTVSGGDLPADRLAKLPDLAPGVGIHKTYGQSENFRTTALRPEEFTTHPRSVGRPFKDVCVYVVRDDGSRCAAGEEGEIVHTGLGVMLGYLGKIDDQARQKLRPNPFDPHGDTTTQAIFTGDIGWLDEDGYLYLRGRRDAMLKVSGNRIYPAEIAVELLKIPSVIEAEVVGVKSTEGETVLAAFLVRERVNPDSTSMDIRREMASRLPTYMMPRHTVDLPAMPRTASGKPDRPALVAQAELLVLGTDARTSSHS